MSVIITKRVTRCLECPYYQEYVCQMTGKYIENGLIIPDWCPFREKKEVRGDTWIRKEAEQATIYHGKSDGTIKMNTGGVEGIEATMISEERKKYDEEMREKWGLKNAGH